MKYFVEGKISPPSQVENHAAGWGGDITQGKKVIINSTNEGKSNPQTGLIWLEIASSSRRDPFCGTHRNDKTGLARTHRRTAESSIYIFKR